MKNMNHADNGPLASDRPVPLAELIVGSLTGQICAINVDRTIAFANLAMGDLFGAIKPYNGLHLADIKVDTDLLDRFKKEVEQVFETHRVGNSARLKHDFINEPRHTLFTWTPIFTAHGAVKMVIGQSRNGQPDELSAKLLQARERHSFMLDLSDALRPLSDTAAIQRQATRLLGEYLNVDRTYYAACDELLQLAVIEQDYVRTDAPSLRGIHLYADFEAIVKTIRTGRIFVAEDVIEMAEVKPQLNRYLTNLMRALVAVPLMKNGEMVACLAITSSATRCWLPGEISLLEEAAERTWEAVERGRYETALKKNEQLMSTIFESLPVGVGVVENNGAVSLSNKEPLRYLPEHIMPSADDAIAARWKAWDARGNPLEQSGYPGMRAAKGESILPGIEMLYTSKDGKSTWTQVAAVPFRNPEGKKSGLITVITNIDHIKRTRVALEEIGQQFEAFVAASSDLVYRMSPDWKQMYTLSGSGFLKKTTEPNYDWLESYIPGSDQRVVTEATERAIAEKSMLVLEHRVNLASGALGWVISRAIPLLDEFGEIREWLGAVTDITSRKNAEQQLKDFTLRLEQQVDERTKDLKASRDQLQSILDTSLMQMSILQAVRDEHGEVSDIEIMLVNKKHEQVMGRNDLIGLHYVKEYPGMKQSVLFGLIVKTIETGEPQETEYYYPFEGFNSWYASMFVKLNDGVVAFTMDISTRKNAEKDRFKNYLLLQQSEKMALMGSWDFDLSSGVFTCSDGMYRLFDLPEQIEISPEIYLHYTTDNGRQAAERVVFRIHRCDADFEESLEFNVRGGIKIVQLKASVLRDEKGLPVRLLGVNMDNTESKANEEKIREVESAQQGLIFRTTMATQEEERRRISESLHNGLAQTLYAIKINLAYLTIEKALNKPDKYATDKKYTQELLIGAIAESRRISHELVPSILEDFGLRAAVNDVCKQLNSKIKFSCSITGFDIRLDKYIELASFRIIQELLLNVAKHSGATKASAEVDINSGNIQIKVEDNGRGMEATGNDKPGIGLASIRSKIKLLNGIIKIQSQSGVGTIVTVRMPLPPGDKN